MAVIFDGSQEYGAQPQILIHFWIQEIQLFNRDSFPDTKKVATDWPKGKVIHSFVIERMTVSLG